MGMNTPAVTRTGCQCPGIFCATPVGLSPGILTATPDGQGGHLRDSRPYPEEGSGPLASSAGTTGVKTDYSGAGLRGVCQPRGPWNGEWSTTVSQKAFPRSAPYEDGQRPGRRGPRDLRDLRPMRTVNDRRGTLFRDLHSVFTPDPSSQFPGQRLPSV